MLRAHLAAALALATACAACSAADDRASPAADPGAPADAGGIDAADASDAAPPLDASDARGDSALPDRIGVGITNGSIALPFTVDLAGNGSGPVSQLAIAGGAGTATVRGATLPALVYDKQPFGAYTLYQALAVAPDRWFVLWAYCQGGQLVDVYYEGTDGTPVVDEPASGTCVESDQPSTAPIFFPAIDMPLPPLLHGFTVTGPDVDLPDGAPGELRLDGGTFAVLPFNTVDCTTICGSPGWRELHALLWDPARGRACFAIFYLFPPGGRPVTLAYSLTLPDLSDPAGTLELDATWTGP